MHMGEGGNAEGIGRDAGFALEQGDVELGTDALCIGKVDDGAVVGVHPQMARSKVASSCGLGECESWHSEKMYRF